MAQPTLAEFEALALANLSHENATRMHAEQTLVAFKSAQPAAFMQALLALLAVPTAAPQSREFAAVLLRQNLLVNSISPVWAACGGDTQRAIQQELLRLFSTERAPSLRKKITDAVAATATRISGGAPLNLATNGKGVMGAAAAAAGIKTAAVVPVPEGEQAKWDELMPTVMSLAQADAVETRQSLLDLIDKLAEFNARILQPHLAVCKSIIMRGLKDKDMPIRMSALRACISVLLSLTESERGGMQECVPLMFEVLGSAYQQADDETIVAAVTVLSDLATVSPKFLKNHLKPVLAAMIHMVACQTLEAETRRVAMSFLLTLAEEGRGMVRKASEFAAQVVPLAFGLVQELQHTPEWDNPDEEHEGDDNDGQDNFKFGCECIARLSAALGGKIFLQVISPLIQRAFQDKEHWNVRHAALITIAQMAQGVDKHMEPQLKSIMTNFIVPTALHDPHHRVRWAAADACAFLSDCYEPDFANNFTDEVFTVLMACVQPAQPWRVIAHACLCFPDFCRGLEKARLMPYMPVFLTAMVPCLGMMQYTKVVENALAAVSSVAMVAEKDFAQYYGHFMPGVKGIITSAVGPRQKGVRGKAIECMGMMAQAVGAEIFGPEVSPVMEALLHMLNEERLPSDDPQHPHVVTTMARICRVMGRAFAPYLPRVIPPLIVSARIEDACVIVNEGEANPYQSREGYKTSTVDVRQTGTQQISLNTTLLEEKSRAIRMLFEYANTMGADFFPYVDEVAAILVPCVRYQFESNVRSNATMALAPLLRCANEALASDPAKRAAYAQQLFTFMWPVVLEGIKVEYELDFLCDILGEWTDVIEALPPGVALGQEQIDELNEVVRRLVIECLERCQKRDELANSDDCDEAEQELIDLENQHEDEFLGYIYSLVNRVVKNNTELYPESFHEKLHPIFNAMMQSDDVSLRTSAICVIAQVMEDCPSHARSREYAASLHESCVKSIETDDVGLKQSAAFGLGVCAMVGRESYAPHALGVMQLLANMVDEAAKAAAAGGGDGGDEDGEDMGLATDNALGAVGKIFVCTFNSGASAPPAVGALMTRWLAALPCESDLIESRKIHAMLADFVLANNPAIMGENGRNLPVILGIIAAILARQDWEEVCAPETKEKFVAVFQLVQKQMAEPQLHALFAAMNQEQKEAFRPFLLNPTAY